MDEQISPQNPTPPQPNIENTQKDNSNKSVWVTVLIPIIVLALILVAVYFLYDSDDEDLISPDSIKVEEIISDEQISQEVSDTVSNIIPAGEFEVNVISDIYENPFNEDNADG
tara:strand:- start:141 stop:479 length:339 start_codon:yes stop_codon:yes gene_type:complete